MVNSKIINDNDLYFFEIVDNRIIINDNYEGVIILDKDFNEICKLKIFIDFVVDISFKKADCIVLCCYEKQCFVRIDVSSLEFRVISFCDGMENLYFQNYYLWQDDILFMMADGGSSIVKMNLNSSEIVLIKDADSSEMSEQYKALKQFANFLVHKTFSDKNTILIVASPDMVLIDYLNGTQMLKGKRLIDFHDIEVFDDYVVQISETIILISNSEKSIEVFPSTANYRFLRAKFIRNENEIFLILLSCCNSDSQLAKFEKLNLPF
ncbi:MAG: hypothetical protein LBU48_04565 [Coriobacteriales bacterium]|jgi:hypothetical protein|nr:hypothetical protein [Coriobacteriales bacterium]